jgi:hypothetical protein
MSRYLPLENLVSLQPLIRRIDERLSYLYLFTQYIIKTIYVIKFYLFESQFSIETEISALGMPSETTKKQSVVNNYN